jgi:hypothetical protein
MISQFEGAHSTPADTALATVFAKYRIRDAHNQRFLDISGIIALPFFHSALIRLL